MKIETAIKHAKKRLIEKAQRDGLCENFGAKEVLVLEENYIYCDWPLIDRTGELERRRKLVLDFENWCSLVTCDVLEAFSCATNAYKNKEGRG